MNSNIEKYTKKESIKTDKEVKSSIPSPNSLVKDSF